MDAPSTREGGRNGYDWRRFEYQAGRPIPGPHDAEWAAVVGARIRRLRRARGFPLKELSHCLYRPGGGRYSGNSLSRIERGWATSPLYVYLALAQELGVSPGRLLGADDVEREVSEAEAVLLRFLERAGISPDEAIARLAAPP